ncbi:MAG: fluoride efflux transporter CrcB [Acidimicrobiales bacterium]
MSPLAWVAFVAAGATGAPLRYLIGGAIADRADSTFPSGTLVVNVTGALLLGVLTGLALYHGLARTPRVVIGTGFCGAYTTFSTFTYETVGLIEDGAIRDAIRNIGLTFVTCGVAAAAGIGLMAL